MGRSRYKIYDSQYPHFVTFTFIRWIPLFSYPEVAQICLDSFKYLQENDQLELFGWVFMENHLHAIARSQDLSSSIARMKSFTGKKILKFLKLRSNKYLLEELSFGKIFHKHSQDFQVWQEGSHPEQIIDRKMMEQKLNYIHYNPVKRGYVDHAEQWRYSSARTYSGEDGLLPISSHW